MGPLDLQRWRQFGIPEDYASRATRQGRAYESMGCLPTWTCAPYQGYLTPRFGQHLAWGRIERGLLRELGARGTYESDRGLPGHLRSDHRADPELRDPNIPAAAPEKNGAET